MALESRGHLYSLEASANTWYAKGACYLSRGDPEQARAAFREALERVPRHPMAHAGLAVVDGDPLSPAADPAAPEPIDLAIARAARLVWAHDQSSAVPIVTAALAAAPPGNGGWLLPIEPLIRVRARPRRVGPGARRPARAGALNSSDRRTLDTSEG